MSSPPLTRSRRAQSGTSLLGLMETRAHRNSTGAAAANLNTPTTGAQQQRGRDTVNQLVNQTAPPNLSEDHEQRAALEPELWIRRGIVADGDEVPNDKVALSPVLSVSTTQDNEDESLLDNKIDTTPDLRASSSPVESNGGGSGDNLGNELPVPGEGQFYSQWAGRTPAAPRNGGTHIGDVDDEADFSDTDEGSHQDHEMDDLTQRVGAMNLTTTTGAADNGGHGFWLRIASLMLLLSLLVLQFVLCMPRCLDPAFAAAAPAAKLPGLLVAVVMGAATAWWADCKLHLAVAVIVMRDLGTHALVMLVENMDMLRIFALAAAVAASLGLAAPSDGQQRAIKWRRMVWHMMNFFIVAFLCLEMLSTTADCNNGASMPSHEARCGRPTTGKIDYCLAPSVGKDYFARARLFACDHLCNGHAADVVPIVTVPIHSAVRLPVVEHKPIGNALMMAH